MIALCLPPALLNSAIAQLRAQLSYGPVRNAEHYSTPKPGVNNELATRKLAFNISILGVFATPF